MAPELFQHIGKGFFQIVPTKAKSGGFQAFRQRALAAEYQNGRFSHQQANSRSRDAENGRAI